MMTEQQRIKLVEVKNTVNQKIRTVEGEVTNDSFENRSISHQAWIVKSLNALEVIGRGDVNSQDHQAACALLERKNKLRDYYHTRLKPLVLQMSDEELKDFDPRDETHWSDCDVT